MRLEPSDPDIETVVTRIERGDLDLQPGFQRGEVWSRAKKQRLIDSILRDWHIPPIHVIELKESRKQEVLDGQQRLAAIRDFVRGDFLVDGSIEPLDPEIYALSGKRFRDLPSDWRRRFNQFTLRIFRIVDYRSEEPAELFFRLNQPTSLTAAEQRNAFFGPVRVQIKDLVALLSVNNIDKTVLGFSNSRMAYDDVLSRVCLTVKRQSLSEKVTASDLVELYRSDTPLPATTMLALKNVIEVLGAARPAVANRLKLNKATAFSWIMFAIRAQAVSPSGFTSQLLGEFMNWFESKSLSAELEPSKPMATLNSDLLAIFADRSASRVADVSSVILRDAIIWLGFEEFSMSGTRPMNYPIELVGLSKIHAAYSSTMGSPFGDDEFARNLVAHSWGNLS